MPPSGAVTGYSSICTRRSAAYHPQALIPHEDQHVFLGFLEKGMWKTTACRRYVVRLLLGESVILNQNTPQSVSA